MKLIYKEQMIEQAEEGIKRSENKREVYKLVLDILDRFNGKNITKRVASAIEKELQARISSGYQVEYAKSNGWFEFSIFNTDESYLITKDNNFSIMISESRHTKDGKFDNNKFVTSIDWIGSCNSKIEQYNKEIDFLNDDGLVNTYNEAVRLVRETRKKFNTDLGYKLD